LEISATFLNRAPTELLHAATVISMALALLALASEDGQEPLVIPAPLTAVKTELLDHAA